MDTVLDGTGAPTSFSVRASFRLLYLATVRAASSYKGLEVLSTRSRRELGGQRQLENRCRI